MGTEAGGQMLSRRKFFRHTARVVMGAAAGMPSRGLAQPPAAIKGTTIHYLASRELVPAAESELLSITAEFGKQAGVSVTVEFVSASDLQPRLIAALQSGGGPDVVRLVQNWPRLYASGLLDMSNVAEPIGKRDGGFYDQMIGNCRVGQEWKAVPFVIRPVTVVWNVDLLQKIGEKVPATWEEYAQVVTRGRQRGGYLLGWTLAHDLITAPGFVYPLLWSFGGREVDAEGKKVAIDSQASRNAVGFLTSLWKQGGTAEALSWDAVANRDRFLAEQTIATVNTAGLYLAARARRPDVAKGMRYAQLPKGPGGVFHRHVTQAHGVLKSSKNDSLARKLIEFLMVPDRMLGFLQAQNAGSIGPSRAWETSKLWQSDPVTASFQTIGASGREVGFPGPPGSAATEVLTKFIIVDMFAKALQGMGAVEVVRWAANELAKIYAR